ncbi:uncharacterized protein LOC143445063 isoform X2 [Clavelina lepadiformis]|uniref:uncharacterized protein LOC143445063 isoform X2 n=1 Tax=Clavelina lepadiformis TaxID=159417 RepID=UPI00404114A9
MEVMLKSDFDDANQPQLVTLQKETPKSLPENSDSPVHLVCNMTETMLAKLNQLRKQRLLCDVIFHVQGQDFYAHKVIMASCSDFCQERFTRKENEENQTRSAPPKLALQNLSAEGFKNLLDLIYTGKLSSCKNANEELLQAARSLKVKEIISLQDAEKNEEQKNSLRQSNFNEKTSSGRQTCEKNLINGQHAFIPTSKNSCFQSKMVHATRYSTGSLEENLTPATWKQRTMSDSFLDTHTTCKPSASAQKSNDAVSHYNNCLSLARLQPIKKTLLFSRDILYQKTSQDYLNYLSGQNNYRHPAYCNIYPFFSNSSFIPDKTFSDKLLNTSSSYSPVDNSSGCSVALNENDCIRETIATVAQNKQQGEEGAATNQQKGIKNIFKSASDEKECFKPYRCPLCEATFNRPANLKTHMRIHSGEKPYKCETCGARFVQVAHLRAHILIHTGEKPYPCSVCGTSFRHLQTLKSHLRIHTGEKPYSCDICQIQFRHKSQLRLHLRTKHGIQTNTKKTYKQVPGLCSSDISAHIKRAQEALKTYNGKPTKP